MKAPVAVAACAAVGVVGSLLISRRRPTAAKRLLNRNYGLLSDTERRDASTLINRGYSYLYRGWPAPGDRDAQKHKLLATASSYLHSSGESLSSLEQERQALIQPPKAEKRPKTLQDPHGQERQDPYYWMRDDDREDPAVLAHLEAENAYTKAALSDTEQLQRDLTAELRARIQEADETAPVRRNGYFYYERTEEGKQYTVHCRRKVKDESSASTDMATNAEAEEVMLDENAEAAQHKFYMTAAVTVSPSTQLMAYAVDTQGGEKYDIQVRDLSTGKDLLPKSIQNTSGNVIWAKDSRTLLYVTKQDKILRPYKVWRHTIGSDQEEDKVVFEEDDEAYNVGISKSRDGNWLLISTGSAVTSDVRYCAADNPGGEWKMVLPRQHNVEYDADPRGDHFFIEIRDEERLNGEVLVSSIADTTQTTVLVPHREDVRLEGVDVSQDYLAVQSRSNALQTVTVYRLPSDGSMPKALGDGEPLDFEEPAYSLGGARQGDFDSPLLRLRYSSLTTPPTTIEHNMSSGKRRTVKEMPILGGFQRGNYVTERRWAKAPDGTKVPLTLLWRKDGVKLDGSDPLLLDGYGSYEYSNDPGFHRNTLSLVNRGFIYAIAHIRGGGEMGRQWYENGKYLHKKNTFTDFIAVSEYLIREGLTTSSKLCIQGRSAGGLTMGAVLNMRPDLFSAAIAGVPFVDCLTTMLDETIPLTTGEWEEWGNPQEREYYDYMLSYSPVDNVASKAYPNILVTSGLHDPRVAYWEPAKWVAKLRELNKSKNMLLIKTNMGAGHFSESGRFDQLGEVALEYAFLLKCQGMLPTERTSS